jgi:hypothetical protein
MLTTRRRAADLRRRKRRPLLRALLVLGAAAAILGLPGAVGAATAATSPLATPAALTAPAALTTPATARHAVTAAVPDQPARPDGGACGVPGIGDIGGLLGFCASGSGLVGDLNNICQPSVPTPEPATGGIDSLIRPPANTLSTKPPATLYDSYGMAGQSWAAFDLQCSDMASLIGNNVAGVVFDAAKALDRVTITVYQSAAGNGILTWLTSSVDKLITALGNAIYFPFLAPVIILGAIWLAWHGLIRKRATRTIEGTLWMVIACAAAIWLIGRPADFTGFGQTVSNGITQTLNVAFAKLPAPVQSNCVPVQQTDPQSPPVASYNYTSGNGVVDTNANELWSVLVCKPWLDGEFGTTAYAAPGKPKTVVNTYGRSLLWAQAIAANEKPTADVIAAKQNAYAGIASSIKQGNPGVYALFQGKQWTTRLEIAFASLFAALIAGVLVLLIAITLIVLKLGFLLLLVAGPFFLIIGTHPGYGRVIALRWGELLIGVLLKQAAIALVLSILLYAYSLIMGTSDAVLPWALKILMISLVTVTVFIYRKPFTHLFSAVGYGVIGSRERADVAMDRARDGAMRSPLDAAGAAIPGLAAYRARAARWARRSPTQAGGVAAQVSAAGAAAGVSSAAGAGPGANGTGTGEDMPDGVSGTGQVPDEGVAAGAPRRGRARAGGGAAAGGARTPPPLDLPTRRGEEAAPTPSGWARGGAVGAGRTRDGAAAPAANGAGRAGATPAGNGWPQAAPRGNGAARGSAPARTGGAARGPAAPRSGGTSAGGSPVPRGSGAARPAAGAGPAPAPAPPAARSAPSPASTAAPRSFWRGGGGAGAAERATRARPPQERPRPERGYDRGGQAPAAPSPLVRTGSAQGPPASRGGGGRAGGGSAGQAPRDGTPAGPFWLRPLRRRK